MHDIMIQFAVTEKTALDAAQIQQIAEKTLAHCDVKEAELTIRVIDVDEMTTLNATYRKKSGPTNVLSFPFEAPEGLDLPQTILGDVLICAEVVNREAKEQGKPAAAHWTHLIIHGILHLLGYDHQTDKEADTMEALEIEILKTFNYPNPYAMGE